MECCRICLSTDELSHIFVTEEIAPNIMAIASVDISQDDDLPQYICLLCNHELDIALNFKNKCETTFEMLKKQHTKELEVRETIILNLLSGGKALDEKLPERVRNSILNTVKNSVKNDMKGKQNLISIQDSYEVDIVKQKKLRLKCSENDLAKDQSYQTQMKTIDHGKMSIKAEQMIDAENQTTTDADDQMTDITENECENAICIRSKDLMCMKCNFWFANEESLLDHLKRIHPKTMEQCQICLLYFPISELLRDHLRLKHDVSEDNDNLDKAIVCRCKICNKTFVHQSELNSHLCFHSDQEDFWCVLCQLNLKCISDYENHMKYVHQKEHFDCEYCDKEFSLIDLFSHLKEHSENRNVNQIELLCSECNKSFLSNEEWNRHIRWCQPKENSIGKDTKNLSDLFDETAKPFVCPLCEKCFKRNTMLEIHIRKHTGEKPFECSHCHKSFGKSSHLTVHRRRTHNANKPHVCSICQSSFYKGNSLEKHLLEHKNLIQITRTETFTNLQVNNGG